MTDETYDKLEKWGKAIYRAWPWLLPLCFLIGWYLAGLDLLGQIKPPTMTIKARHGQTQKVAWDFTNDEHSAGLLYFKIQATPDLNQPPAEIKQAAPTDRAADIVLNFDKANPQYLFLIMTAIYENPLGESFPSNTIAVQRIGPPPTE